MFRFNWNNNKKKVGISFDSFNGSNNILVKNMISSQKKNNRRMFNGSMVQYVNSPSASCGCGKN
jgi:hypothetical protein